MREQLPIWILLNYLLLSNQCGAQNWKNAKVSITLMFLLSHFSFFVFGHCWRQSCENTKILCNLCLHFAKQDGQDGKNREKNYKTLTIYETKTCTF